jgi:hypothetical protein
MKSAAPEEIIAPPALKSAGGAMKSAGEFTEPKTWCRNVRDQKGDVQVYV